MYNLETFLKIPLEGDTPLMIKNMYLNINKKMLMKLMTGTTKLFLIQFFSQHAALNQFLLISLFSQRALQLIISQISLHAVGFKQRANLMQKMAVHAVRWIHDYMQIKF